MADDITKRLGCFMKTETLDISTNYLEKDAIVVVKLSGIMDFDEHRRLCEETFSAGRKYNAHKFLISMLDVIPKLTVLEIDDMPRTLIECGAKPEHRIAALHNPPPPHDRGFVFFRNGASNKSVTIKQFTNEDEALAWLRAEP
jgi:hypothetical protein